MEAYQEHAKEVEWALVELRAKMSEQEKMLSKGERQVPYVSSKKTKQRERKAIGNRWVGSATDFPERDDQNKKDFQRFEDGP